MRTGSIIPRISSRLTGSDVGGAVRQGIEKNYFIILIFITIHISTNLLFYMSSNIPARVRFGRVRFALQPSKSSQQATKKSSRFVEA